MMGIVPKTKIFSQWKFCVILFKVSRFICLFLFFSAISPTFASDEVTPLGLGIFPGILSPSGAKGSVMGVRISPLVGIHRNVHGLDVGLVNVATGHAGALQAGIFNYQHKRMTIFLLQMGGLINWNAGNTGGAGFQLAGLLNKNTGSGYFFGLQGALWNLSPKTNLYGAALGFSNQNGYLRGLQIGAINNASDLGGLQLGITASGGEIRGIQGGLLVSRARKITGIQLGAVNIAERVTGIQLGLFNQAGSLKGLQIGLINLHTVGKIPVFPIINIGI